MVTSVEWYRVTRSDVHSPLVHLEATQMIPLVFFTLIFSLDNFDVCLNPICIDVNLCIARKSFILTMAIQEYVML